MITRILRTADPAAGGTGQPDPAGTPPAGTDPAGKAPEPKTPEGGEQPKLSMTQDDLDKIISNRLKRAEKDWAATLEDEKKKAAMTEGERLKAEGDEALTKASDILSKAHRKSLESDVRIALNGAGVKPDRISAALRLIELDTIEIDKDGAFDPKDIESAVQRFSAEFPELVGATGAPAAGQNFGEAPKAADAITSKAQIDKMTPEERKRRWPEIVAFYAKRQGK